MQGITGYHTSRFTFDQRRDAVWQEVSRFLGERYIPRDARILEIGAGYCHFINNVAGKEKHALDLFEDLPQYTAADVVPHVGSCTDLSRFADNSLDTVFASNLFEHLTPAQMDATLSESRRVLRPGGRLIAIQPNFRYCYKGYFDDYTHVRVFTHVSLSDLLTASGFQLVHVAGRFLPFSMKTRLPKLTFLVRLYLLSPFKPFAGQMLVVAEKP